MLGIIILHILSVVGAAEGRHLNMLADMFPEHYFDLYDPRKFTCKATDRISIFSGGSEMS